MKLPGPFCARRREAIRLKVKSGPAALISTESDVNGIGPGQRGPTVGRLCTWFSTNTGIRFQRPRPFLSRPAVLGGNLNVRSAKRIGLIPNIDDAKILQNRQRFRPRALVWALLVFAAKRRELENLVRRVTHLPVWKTHPDFLQLLRRRVPIPNPVGIAGPALATFPRHDSSPPESFWPCLELD